MRDLETRNLSTSGIPSAKLDAGSPFLNSILMPFLGKMEWIASDSGHSTLSFPALESLTYMTSGTRQIHGDGPLGPKQLGLGSKKLLVRVQGVHTLVANRKMQLYHPTVCFSYYVSTLYQCYLPIPPTLGSWSLLFDILTGYFYLEISDLPLTDFSFLPNW